MRTDRTYPAQLVQNLDFNTLLFKIDPRGVDHILDDLAVDIANSGVRHVVLLAASASTGSSRRPDRVLVLVPNDARKLEVAMLSATESGRD